MLGAVIGAATLVHFGLSTLFAHSWKFWWGSNAMAILVFTPFILAWFSKSGGARNDFGSPGKIAEAVLLFFGFSGSAWYLLAVGNGIMSPNKSLVIPFLLWSGLRFGTRGATAASLLLSLTLAFFTGQFSIGLTPAEIASGEYVFVLQMLMATTTAVALIPAIALGERDRTMGKLRESEERFKNLSAAAFEGICISEDGKILDVNSQFLAMFGYERTEVIGHQIIELVAPESRALVTEAIRTGREDIYEHQLRRKDGSTFFAETRAQMVRVGNQTLRMTALRDITERKQTEQALRESEEKFSKAFRTSPDVMSITDYETNCYLEVNAAHVKTFGFQREEVIGRTPAELGIFLDPATHEQLHRELKEYGLVRGVEIEGRTRDGRRLTLLHSAEIIELGGRLCVLRVSHDITERKRAETERDEARSREAQARAEYTLQLIAAQEAERTRIARELHDSLGQNLLLIKNRAELQMAGAKLPASLREELQSISDIASQAIAEVRQISYDLHPPQLELLGLTRALRGLIENTRESGAIAIDGKFDSVDDLFPREAATNVYRIVQESLNNILKHSRAKRARISLERDVHEVLLKIEDEGCGFKTGAGGKGLGLKNIAERVRMLGGKLKLDSQPDRGTRIEITIPISAEHG
jgi:PAS domain S-box-containing protein